MTEKSDEPVKNDAETAGPEDSETGKSKTTEGVQWEKMSDPLADVKKSANEVLEKMEGKTVSMKTYVGTIIGVVLLMLLARCGG